MLRKAKERLVDLLCLSVAHHRLRSDEIWSLLLKNCLQTFRRTLRIRVVVLCSLLLLAHPETHMSAGDRYKRLALAFDTLVRWYVSSRREEIVLSALAQEEKLVIHQTCLWKYKNVPNRFIVVCGRALRICHSHTCCPTGCKFNDLTLISRPLHHNRNVNSLLSGSLRATAAPKRFNASCGHRQWKLGTAAASESNQIESVLRKRKNCSSFGSGKLADW